MSSADGRPDPLTRTGPPPFAGELATYRAARARAADEPLDIVLYGNSILQGTARVRAEECFCARLGDALNRRFGTGGAHGPGYSPARTIGTPTSNRWRAVDRTGTARQDRRFGLGHWTHALAATGEARDELAVGPLRFRHLSLVLTEWDTLADGGVLAGSCEVWVDDELAGIVDTRRRGLPENEFRSHRTSTLGPFPDTEHEVRLRPAGTAGGTIGEGLLVDGVFAHREAPDRGVRLWNGGHAGFPAKHTVIKPNAFDVLDRLEPALVVFEHDFNDRLVGLDEHAEALDTFAAHVAERSPTSSVVLATEYRGPSWTPDQPDWHAVSELTRAKAAEHGFALLDLAALVGDLGFDGVPADPCGFAVGPEHDHPTAAGHEYLASAYAAFLADEPLPGPWCEQARDPTQGPVTRPG